MTEIDDVDLKRLDGRWKSDVDLKLDRADSRLRTIERLVWIATGGVIVLSAVSAIGVSILSSFATKLDQVSNAQAVSSVEARVKQESLQQQLDAIRNQRIR